MKTILLLVCLTISCCPAIAADLTINYARHSGNYTYLGLTAKYRGWVTCNETKRGKITSTQNFYIVSRDTEIIMRRGSGKKYRCHYDR